MRPSDTIDGRRWLANFLPDDRRTAARLLDALRFVSEDEFRAGIKQLLIEVAHRHAGSGPVAFYPVRPAGRTEMYSEPSPDRTYGPLGGSELVAANVISEVVKTLRSTEPGMHAFSMPGLDELREQRVRTIVLVDDSVASGSTIVGYLDRWWENRTIRSWRSGGRIRFALVTYACSTRGRAAAEQHRLLDDL